MHGIKFNTIFLWFQSNFVKITHYIPIVILPIRKLSLSVSRTCNLYDNVYSSKRRRVLITPFVGKGVDECPVKVVGVSHIWLPLLSLSYPCGKALHNNLYEIHDTETPESMIAFVVKFPTQTSFVGQVPSISLTP